MMPDSPKNTPNDIDENIAGQNTANAERQPETENAGAACQVGSPCCCAVRTTCIIVAIGLITFLAIRAMCVGRLCLMSASCGQCVDRLKQIGVALRAYEQKYGCYPPAYATDAAGQPTHSWRVLILPFLGDDAQKIAKEFKLGEPWNSEANRKAAKAAAQFFQSSKASHAPGDVTTDYVMIIGDHMISDGPKARKAKEIKDGLTDTIAAVEVADSDIPWNKPQDLAFARINPRINSAKRMCISGNQAGGAMVLFCDGHVRWLDEKTNPELVRAMLTIDGGEPVK